MGKFDTPKKVIFLDRNAVSSIKDSLEGKKTCPKRLAKLRWIDEKSNFVSPMMSIIEGQTGKRENEEQMLETIGVESTAISRFFRHARTDSDFLGNTANEMALVFANNIEYKWDSYIRFVKVVRGMLYQRIGDKDKPKYKSDILQLARQNDIAIGHPIVICCLSVLYNCDKTRSIIKPKKNIAEDPDNKAEYNAVSDIILISRLGHIQAIINKNEGKKVIADYLTFDEGLNFFQKKIRVIEQKLIDDDGIFMKTTYSRKLFPDLDEAGYIALCNELKEMS